MSELLGEPVAEAPEDEPEPEDEPGTPEPEPEDEDEPEVEPEPEDDDEPEATVPAGPSEADIDRVFKSLEGRASRYTRGVDELLAESEAPFVKCAVCSDGIPGYFIDPRIVPLPDVAEAAMRALLGIGQEPPFANDPDANECPRCEGWGQTRTGSKVDKQRLVQCKECRGKGWIGSAADLLPEQVAELPNLADVYVPPADEPPPDEDAWGTPRDHPEFGKSPQYREPGWQERIAAYKAGEPAPIAA